MKIGTLVHMLFLLFGDTEDLGGEMSRSDAARVNTGLLNRCRSGTSVTLHTPDSHALR
jgi:hypothetical protein